MIKICFVTAIPMTVEAFLVDYIRCLSKDYDITVVTNTEDTDFLKPYGLNCNIIPAPIEREISPIKDIYALLRLYGIFCKKHFQVVHSVTPKAGLLSMVASFLVRVPVRVHTFTGQVWATKKGIKRWFLKNMDRLIVRCATHILTDSKSQMEFMIKEKVVQKEKVGLIGHGSIRGVDIGKFFFDINAKKEIRQRHNIGDDDFVFLFLGRLNREKGIMDLIEAFKKVANTYRNAHLLIAGPDEENIMDNISKNPCDVMDRIHYAGLTKSPEKYMSASDCICLPSYREGFGLVIIEAAACGIPAIGSRIYGIVDAIEEGTTGLFHAPGDVDGLSRHMEWMLTHEKERLLMGKNALKRAINLFSMDKMVEDFKAFYRDITGD